MHTLGRCVFELSRISSARSRSASASTYTWQLPTPVSITGTVDSRHHGLDQPGATPRNQYVDQPARLHEFLHRGPIPGTPWTTSAGNPADSAASRSTAMIASLDAAAEDEPRSRTALPDFRQIPAASAVTFGRAS